jgi:ech hydrogenase subunit D
MAETQTILTVTVDQLTEKVKMYFEQGYRLVQIGATRTEGFEINYSFDKAYEFINLKLTIASAETEIPSVSGIYWSAFLYENEIHDLFGIRFGSMAVDYHGAFYKIAVKTPFGENS